MMKISKSISSVAGGYEDGCGIYRIKNCSNGKSYIGETHQFRIRTYQHCTDLRCGRHKNKDLQHDYDSGDEFEFSLIYPIKMYSREWEKKRIFETFFILKNDAVENGFNKCYNRFTEELAWKSIIENLDVIKFSVPDAEYICRQMISEDEVEINP